MSLISVSCRAGLVPILFSEANQFNHIFLLLHMTSVEFQHIIQTLPQQPGIYKYYDKHEELLYVGKAKNLTGRRKQSPGKKAT